MMDQALLCLFVEETVERSYPPDLGTLSGGQSGLVHKTNVGETDRESGTHKFTQNLSLFLLRFYIFFIRRQ